MYQQKRTSKIDNRITRAADHTPYKKKYSNPYFQDKKKRTSVRTPALGLKFKLSLAGIILIIIGAGWLVLFSPLFTITNIEVVLSAPADNDIPAELRIDPEKIKALAGDLTAGKAYSVLPRNNLYLYDENALFAAVNNVYNYDSISLKRTPPHTITVTIKERDYAILWSENDKLYFIDTHGTVIADASSTEESAKQYPLIENQGGGPITDKHVAIDNLDYIISLYGKLSQALPDYKIDKIIVNNDPTLVNVKITDGPEIYFNSAEDADKQLNKLTTLITERIKDDFAKKAYIDLRYGDRVYYR